MANDTRARWQHWAQRCEQQLDQAIQARAQLAPHLAKAMAYASLGGGKRMRPLLVYATGTSLGADEADLDAAAAAVELIHAYSLVHDDLPAMDNDGMRRGKPTVHIAFDEATAILPGDALQALAFEVLLETRAEAASVLAMARTLASAIGSEGLAAGQAIDLAEVGHTLSLERLRTMHAAKTGALIRASVALGALVAQADADIRARLDDFAQDLGLAFQIRDDILDIEGASEQLGKTAGKDAANAKPTYPALLGLDGSCALLMQLQTRMHAALDGLAADTNELRHLADFAAQRTH